MRLDDREVGVSHLPKRSLRPPLKTPSLPAKQASLPERE